ncbi:MAG TPA: glycosyltransferase family 39 protein [Bauldia sp.]|nr:glycosyltransferase family 39 protein [Bauldia sp.]
MAAIAIIAALTIVRFWASARIDLAPDEAYYWLWSRIPSAGYFDHPPMVAWWIWASTAIFGDTGFGVRAVSIVAGAVTSYAVYATARNLGLFDVLATRGAIWFNATILVGVGTILMSPDSPSVLFWAVATWVLSDIRRSGDGWLWVIVGLFAGLGCLSKYSNLFFGLGVLLWLLLDRDARRWFLSPWPYIGAGVALLVFIPVLWWNAEHNWISFAKQFGRISTDGIELRYVGEFLAGQVGLLNPLIAIFVGLGLWRGAQSVAGDDTPHRGALVFFLSISAPLVLYMFIHSFHASVQGNWLAPAYPTLVLIGAVAASDVSARPLQGLARLAAPVGIVTSVLALGFFVAPTPTPFGFQTPAERLIGWRDLAGRIEQIRQSSGAQWIATGDYGLTGELAFYGAGPKIVQQVDERQRYLFDSVDPRLAEAPALLVLRKGKGDLRKFRRCFESVEHIADVERVGPDGPVAIYGTWLAVGADADILTEGCR